MTALTPIVALVAFALFGLATPAHHERYVGGFPLPAQQRRLRWGAWGAVVTTFAAAIAAQGWVFGPILWLGSLMLAAGVVFLTLNLIPPRPRSSAPISRDHGLRKK